MAKQAYVPETLDSNVATLSDAGLALNITLPPKVFKTGKNGFFKQGMITLGDKKYRLNLMVYSATSEKKSDV